MKRKLIVSLTGIAMSLALAVTGCAGTTGKSKGGDSDETTADLKTVEPGAYAGKTVYGKVISISDSQITVSLGTYNKDASKDTSVTQTSVTGDAAEVIDTAASSDDNSTDTSAENTETKSKKKKSRFTANGEQMTVTIPESLADTEIKEKYVLSITLDEQGNVAAIEVVSKGRRK